MEERFVMICMRGLIGEWIKAPLSKIDCFQGNLFLNGMTQIHCSESVDDKAFPLQEQWFHLKGG